MTLTQELTDYIHAAFAGLWIETHEPDEAQREITSLAAANQWIVRVWDCAKGDHDTKEGKGDPLHPLKTTDAQSKDVQTTKIILLHNYHAFLKNPVVIQALYNAVIQGKQARNFYLILSPIIQLPPELEKVFVVIEHPLPTPEDIQAIARDIFNEEKADPHQVYPTDCAAGLTRYEAEGAFALSAVRNNGFQEQEVWNLKAGLLKKSGLLELHPGSESFSNLGGLASLKTFCKRALKPHPTGSPVRPKGILLLGVPGTGKSAFAKALGNEMARPTLLLDIGRLYGSLVGETEGKVRQALKIADAMAPCILFIDEIEKALAGVGSNGDSGVSTRLFGTLLTWLSDHTSDVFVVATSNDVSKLPPEFSRAERWDGIFFLDLPTFHERGHIWQLYKNHYGIKQTGRSFADDTWTGAEIKACCRLAALLDLDLDGAAKCIVPVAVTAADKVQGLREWASNRCLSASEAGIYHQEPKSPPPARRKLAARS